jgi:hypothetical protein
VAKLPPQKLRQGANVFLGAPEIDKMLSYQVDRCHRHAFRQQILKDPLDV